jgi:hypothetical protein
MNDSRPKSMESEVGYVSISSSIANLAGDLTRLIQIVQQEDCGSCSECLKGWTRINSGLEEVATWLLVTILNRARRLHITTERAGTDAHA